MARVAGKVALVTGAGTGIGRAVAVLLAEEGAEVIVTSRNPGGEIVLAHALFDSYRLLRTLRRF